MKKRTVGCLLSGLLLTVLFCAALAYGIVSWLFFTGKPLPRPSFTTSDQSAYTSGQFKIANALMLILAGSFERRNDVQVFEITKDEFNAVMAYILGDGSPFLEELQRQAIEQGDGNVLPKEVFFAMSNDSFLVEYSKKTFYPMLFGSYLNLSADVVLSVENGKLSVMLKKVLAGNYKTNGGDLSILPENITGLLKGPDADRIVSNAVKSLRIRDGVLRIEYRPYYAKQELRSYMERNGMSFQAGLMY